LQIGPVNRSSSKSKVSPPCRGPSADRVEEQKKRKHQRSFSEKKAPLREHAWINRRNNSWQRHASCPRLGGAKGSGPAAVPPFPKMSGAGSSGTRSNHHCPLEPSASSRRASRQAGPTLRVALPGRARTRLLKKALRASRGEYGIVRAPLELS